MKKRLTLFSLLLLFTMTAMAQTLVDGIYYNLNRSDNTAEVTSGTKYSGDIVIPASISVDGVDYSVTEIGRSAFSSCDGLTSIEIPNSVTSIGDYAFSGCSGLRSIEIPNSVTSIGDKAFGDCYRLTSIEIPNSVTSIEDFTFWGCSGLRSIEIPNSVTSIGDYAFSGCYGLTSIEIPNSVISIGDKAFENCSGLTSIEIPNSVTEIGRFAFEDCSGLTSIEIPTSVTSIGESAFSGCSGLTSIEIPTSVTSIGESAFTYCSGLTSIVVEEGNSYYDSREDCNAIIETSSNTLVAGCQNTVIPNSVTSIGVEVFSGCSGLTSIEIPTSVTSIGESAFTYCSGLTSIEIPNSVTEIGDYAFSRCSGLTSIEIPNSVTSIGYMAFSRCSGLTSIEIPNSVTSIGVEVFSGCSGLTSIEIPNSVTSIGYMAFFDCDGLTSIEIPNSVTEIGDYAFFACDGLTSITMQRATPPTVGGDLFYGSNLETIYVPAGASEAYNVAPWNAYNIVEYYVPRHNGTKTYNGRDVIAVKLTGEYSGEQVYTLTSAERNKDYTDVTASVVFKVVSGEILTPVVDHEYNKNWGSWMHHAVYIDTDRNGFTGAIAEGSEWKPAGDLVTYSFYNNGAASDASGWNSVGEVISGDNRSNPPLPDFTAPTEPGIYRMRFVQDWCSIDPAGDADGKFGDFKSNGGQIVDVMLEVVEGIADPEPQPIEGKYYILKSRLEGQRVAYEKNDGIIGLQENWATPSSLQMADLSFIWKANVVGTDSVRLQNVASKKYLDATYTLYQAYTTTEEGTTFRLTATEGSYYNLSDAKDLGYPYMHADAPHSYVVRWEGASYKANQWQFVDVDAELVAPLLAQQDLNVELEAKLALLNEKIYQPIVEDFSNHGLLKSASQLSTNKQETKEGHISNLLDGDGNTYFHSTWSSVNTDNAYHFIQADLKQTVDSITVKYVRRNHSYNDSPKSIRVFATNNPAGDWDEIAVLESPTQQSYFGIILSGGTLNFNLGNKYRYVRFVVEETHSGQVNNDNLFFSWSEFGIWDNNGEEFLPEDKRTEINNVIATAKQELKDLAATQSTIDQLVEWAAYVDKYVFLTDGEDYTNATEQETERITYTREFKNTQWQSWYVPFDMDYNDISDEYTAACLNDIHEYDDDEDGVLDRWTMEVLILRPGETMYANLPYVIRAKAVGEKQFVVENTMLYPADEQSMDCSSMRMHYTFTGTYSPIEAQVLRDNGWLAMGNGRLVTPTTTSTLKANRWYLESTPRKGYGSTYQAPKRIELVVVDENGEVTGIEELPLTEDENAVWPADVYDLNGRLVKAQAKNLEDLPKGVYVVNGQKWVK